MWLKRSGPRPALTRSLTISLIKILCPGLANTYGSLTSNSLLQTTYKRTDITALRAEELTKPTLMSSLMSKTCLDMVLKYTNKLYHQYGGEDNPNQFSIQVLRMMPRPFINFNADPFSDVSLQTKLI